MIQFLVSVGGERSIFGISRSQLFIANKSEFPSRTTGLEIEMNRNLRITENRSFFSGSDIKGLPIPISKSIPIMIPIPLPGAKEVCCTCNPNLIRLRRVTSRIQM
jgi:hypothetical protein